MARRRKPAPQPLPWPDRLSLVNEVCRRLRDTQDIGYIITVCRCTLQLVLDLKRANERADAIRKRWHIGLHRVLGNSDETRVLAAEIDAIAKAERAAASVRDFAQALPVPADEAAESGPQERARRKATCRKYRPLRTTRAAIRQLSRPRRAGGERPAE